MWNSGRCTSSTSSAVSVTDSPGLTTNCARLVVRFWCVSMTPLDRPVVPLEYGSAARSSMGSIRTSGTAEGADSIRPQNESESSAESSITMKRSTLGAASLASRAISSTLSWTTRIREPLLFSWWAISRSRYPELIVDATPPALMIA